MRRARENHLIQPILLRDDRNPGEVSCPRTQREPGKRCPALPVTTAFLAPSVGLADKPEGTDSAPADLEKAMWLKISVAAAMRLSGLLALWNL